MRLSPSPKLIGATPDLPNPQRPKAHDTICGNSSLQKGSPCEPTRSAMFEDIARKSNGKGMNAFEQTITHVLDSFLRPN